MYTQCPECQTIFRVHDAQLDAAGGRVRCGECMGVFRAPDHQVEQLPEAGGEETFDTNPPPEAKTEASRQPVGETAEDVNIEALLKGVEEEEIPGWERDEGGTSEASAGIGDAAPWEGAPEPTEPPPPPPRPAPPPPPAPEPPEPAAPPMAPPQTAGHGGRGVATAVWTLLILGLTAVLVVQYAYFHREKLADMPQLRPWLVSMCQVAGCDLPPRRAAAAIEVYDPQVQSHPRFGDALLISATLVNGAAFAQPYPEVEVVLKGLGGERIAWRRFRPRDYLVEQPDTPFPAKSQAHLLLEVTDPGPKAVGFEINVLGGRG